MSSPEKKRPIRVGVYDTVAAAQQALQSLQNAGFTDQELSVLCSEQHQAEQFPDTIAEEEDSEEAATAAVAGSALGGSIGGLMAAAGLATVAGIPVLVAGALAATLAGGVVGGLAGAMIERGLEQNTSDFFDQAVSEGKILVSVEPVEQDEQRLAKAAELLKDAGANPISLLEG
ncbi:general stress protein [Adhaeretor mobilis]|uniref:General stress protein 17M-like domain-containing protein n=1 Tax=Adhaeretor mobilis TaxID=1930276 RepID=A0A517MT41_9BACT|nr:general stress protein [Adhaeretor mobilis]QDS98049.1 hypothetical protein HG15A2_13200 [Adhaeretor mobilis]